MTDEPEGITQDGGLVGGDLVYSVRARRVRVESGIDVDLDAVRSRRRRTTTACRRAVAFEATSGGKAIFLRPAMKAASALAKAEPRLARIAAEIDALEVETEILDVPRLDWSWPPETVNGVLRALWERVELGPDLAPLPFPDGFVWRVAGWRTG